MLMFRLTYEYEINNIEFNTKLKKNMLEKENVTNDVFLDICFKNMIPYTKRCAITLIFSESLCALLHDFVEYIVGNNIKIYSFDICSRLLKRLDKNDLEALSSAVINEICINKFGVGEYDNNDDWIT